MHAMQYPIRLPADYDMGIIRDRVATRAPLLDALPGLYLKAYAVQERGTAEAVENQYAPFYLWSSADAMAAFIGGPGFRGVCESFGRPVIHHGVGIVVEHGAAIRDFPHWATHRVERLSESGPIEGAIARARVSAQELVREPTLHTYAASLDPSRWTITHFTLWSEEPAIADTTRYQVLHLSMPSATSDMRVGSAPRPTAG